MTDPETEADQHTDHAQTDGSGTEKPTEDDHDGHDHGGGAMVDHSGHEDMFRRRFFVCLVLSIPVLAYSVTLQSWLGFRVPPFPGSAYVTPVFSVVVFAYGGVPFLRMGVVEARNREPGMMLLISLAITVAFVYSAASVVLGIGEPFFWELVTLVVIFLLGHWIEMRSIRRASGALDELANLMPETAERVTEDGTEEVRVDELEQGDVVLVRPGSNVPADGVVEEGRSSVDESMIIPTVAFLIASTNFVIGLTFVIWALLGWEFAVAQAVGAPIFILISITFVHLTISYDETEWVRERLIKEEQPVVTDPVCKMRINRENGIAVEHKNETVYFCSEGCKRLFEQNPDAHTRSWKEKIRSWNGWVEAANQTKKDLRMLWKELGIGFLLAGIIAAAVPDSLWTVLFEGGGTGTVQVVYNSVLGPLISVATFVASIGNVPLAAVLWGSGFAFGGVIAFIYADLIVPQLILIYRKIFGKKIGNRLTLILFVSMAMTGIIVYYIFSFLGIVPDAAVTTEGEGFTIFGVTPTTLLNTVFLLIGTVFVALLVKGRRGAPGDRTVEDPVTGTGITVKDADYCTVHDESIYYFETEDSRAEFNESPETFV
jgi:YHS domain-containing protein